MNNTESEQVFNVLATTRFGRMLVNRNDFYIGRSLLRYGEYSWEEIALLEQLITADSVVVEAGANIGSHTIPLSQRLNGSGRLYAFEPQRLIYQTLCANLALNSCANVFAFWAGLGSNHADISMPDLSPYEVNNFGGVPANTQIDPMQINPMNVLNVPCKTIDALGLDACSLIKADVEGMELEVIRGAEKTIRAYRPVLYLEADRKDRLPFLIAKLFQLNYKLWWHTPNIYSPDNMFGDSEDIFRKL